MTIRVIKEFDKIGGKKFFFQDSDEDNSARVGIDNSRLRVDFKNSFRHPLQDDFEVSLDGEELLCNVARIDIFAPDGFLEKGAAVA